MSPCGSRLSGYQLYSIYLISRYFIFIRHSDIFTLSEIQIKLFYLNIGYFKDDCHTNLPSPPHRATARSIARIDPQATEAYASRGSEPCRTEPKSYLPLGETPRRNQHQAAAQLELGT